MTAKEVIRRLKAGGWYELKGTTGGHRHFKHPEKSGKIQVAHYRGGDIPLKTLKNIEKMSGISMA